MASQASPSNSAESKSRFSLSRLRAGLSSGVALVASIVSLLIAIAGYLNTIREPEVLMVMPEVVRIGSPLAYADSQTIILQPTFINTAGNGRVEVITGLEVEASRSQAESPVKFRWLQSGVLSLSESNDSIGYKFTSDPAPLLINSASPQQPVAYCDGPPGWRFEADTYEISLIAKRAVVSTPLRDVIRITITREQAELLKKQDGLIYSFQTTP